MNRKHSALVSALIAVAAIAGVFGVLRSTSLAASGSGGATDALVQARTRQLDTVEQQLRSQVAKLDAATSAASAPAGEPSGSASQAAAPTVAAGSNAAAERVVYVRPAPIVRIVPRGEGGEHDDAYEHEEHGEDD